MAFENMTSGGLIGITASADLTGSQFRFVIINGDRTVGLAGDGVAADGVLQDKPDIDQAAFVAQAGDTSKVVAGATVAAGAEVASDTNAAAVTATSGEYILGKCLTGGAVGELLTVALLSPGRVA